MKNVTIPNQEKLEQIKREFQNQGTGSIHILADFDRTLTYSQNPQGKKIKSIISVLREENYLSSEYSEEAKALFEKYHPIEINPEIPLEERKQAMYQWWTSHNKLLLRSGLNRKNLEKIVDSGLIRLRDKTKELFDYAQQNNIPLVIMSSSGLGDTIPMILEKESILYDNVYIITNKFKWDQEGNAIEVPTPVIHAMNKDETAIQDHPEIYAKVKDKKNVILLGDSLGDTGMITGFQYDNLLKIGFLNPGEEQNESQYKQNFDLIITNDSDMEPINKILQDIK